MLRSGSGRRVVSRATTRPESAWEPPAKRFPHRQHQFSKGRFSTTPPTPRRRSVLHGPRRLRLTAALKIDDAVVMCGLEDRSGRVDALEDRGQSPPHRLGAECKFRSFRQAISVQTGRRFRWKPTGRFGPKRHPVADGFWSRLWRTAAA